MRTLTVTSSWNDCTLSDFEAVGFVAGLLDISEYQVFEIAYREWFGKDLTKSTMEFRFDNYLEDEVVPLWVWDFVQQVVRKYELDELDPSDYGISVRTLTPVQKQRRWLYVLLFILFVFFYCWLLSTVPPYIEMSFG